LLSQLNLLAHWLWHNVWHNPMEFIDEDNFALMDVGEWDYTLLLFQTTFAVTTVTILVARWLSELNTMPT
jgi:hypothetical protein